MADLFFLEGGRRPSPDFSPVCAMVAQGFDSPMDFLTERNSRDYFRGKKILWWIKDQARAHESGEKFGLYVEIVDYH